MGQSIPMEVAYFRLTPGIQRRRSVSSVRMVQIECNKKTFLFAAALASFYSVIVASQLPGLQASSTNKQTKNCVSTYKGRGCAPTCVDTYHLFLCSIVCSAMCI